MRRRVAAKEWKSLFKYKLVAAKEIYAYKKFVAKLHTVGPHLTS